MLPGGMSTPSNVLMSVILAKISGPTTVAVVSPSVRFILYTPLEFEEGEHFNTEFIN